MTISNYSYSEMRDFAESLEQWVEWETGVTYKVNATVVFDKRVYRCIVAHTSTLFLNDYQKWVLEPIEAMSSATMSSDGLMSAEDKEKLDNLVAGSGSHVAISTINGNILVDGNELPVYRHPGIGTNPHGTTKADIGLGNVPNVDTTNATNITTGILPLSVLPKSALERLIPVPNQAARFALTTNDVQNGDTVQELNTGLLFYVVDDTRLNSSFGYVEYTAGTASSVQWSGVLNHPTTLAGYGITDATTVEQSATNGALKVNGIDIEVYEHPGYGTNPHGTTAADVGLGNVANIAQVTQVTATLPIQSSGGTTPNISAVIGNIANTLCSGNDPRLSNSRFPTYHAGTHASTGTDPVTIDSGNITNGAITDFKINVSATDDTTITVNAQGKLELKEAVVSKEIYLGSNAQSATNIGTTFVEFASFEFPGTGGLYNPTSFSISIRNRSGQSQTFHARVIDKTHNANTIVADTVYLGAEPYEDCEIISTLFSNVPMGPAKLSVQIKSESNNTFMSYLGSKFILNP